MLATNGSSSGISELQSPIPSDLRREKKPCFSELQSPNVMTSGRKKKRLAFMCITSPVLHLGRFGFRSPVAPRLLRLRWFSPGLLIAVRAAQGPKGRYGKSATLTKCAP